MVINRETKKIITSSLDVKSGEQIEIIPAKGKINAKVENTEHSSDLWEKS